MASVLLYTNNLPSAIEELRKLSSKINQLFTSSLFSASLPETFNLSNLNYSSTFLPEYLNEDEMLFAEAWKEFQIKTATVSKQSPSGLSWDTPGFATPAAIHPGQRYEASSRANFLTGTPTSLYMVGSISMGLILVSGRDGYRLSYDQQRKIISEVQEGLEFLATAEPNARISFHYDLRRVQVSVAPGHTSCFELSEAPWRNAALRAIGYEGSERGSASYVRSLRAQNGTDWAFVAYFSLYPLHHFAYAIDERIVMSYSNDKWGPDKISRVFAHETCHLFGAADEYGNCNCKTLHGHLGEPNRNCRSCATDFTPCLMERDELVLCNATRRQIGWDEELY